MQEVCETEVQASQRLWEVVLGFPETDFLRVFPCRVQEMALPVTSVQGEFSGILLRRKPGCCPVALAVDFPGKSQDQSSARGVSLPEAHR